jgi:hypothetical protein
MHAYTSIYIFKDETLIKPMKHVHTYTLIVYDHQLERIFI